MKRNYLLILLILISLKINGQYFSFTKLVIRNTEFSNEELKRQRQKLLELKSLENQERIAINNANNVPINDEINVDILNTIISYSKNGEVKKVLTKLTEIQNKLNDNGITKVTKANFCYLRYIISAHYNLYIDTSNFQSCYAALDNLQKYTFLYTAYYLSNPTTAFITKIKNEEFINLSSNTSAYDYIKTLSLQLNRNSERFDKGKTVKLLNLRDSTLNYIISSGYKNHYNSNLEYFSFSNPSDYKAEINLEKVISLNDLGYIFRKNNDLSKSVFYFKQAIEVEEKQEVRTLEPELYTNLGLTLTLKKEFDNAESNYEKALKIYQLHNNKSKEAEELNIIAKNDFINSKNLAAISLCNQSLLVSVPRHL